MTRGWESALQKTYHIITIHAGVVPSCSPICKKIFLVLYLCYIKLNPVSNRQCIELFWEYLVSYGMQGLGHSWTLNLKNGLKSGLRDHEDSLPTISLWFSPQCVVFSHWLWQVFLIHKIPGIKCSLTTASNYLLLAQKRFKKRWNILICIICARKRNLVQYEHTDYLGNHLILSWCRFMLTTITSTVLHYIVVSHTDHHCLDTTVSLLRNFFKRDTPWAE